MRRKLKKSANVPELNHSDYFDELDDHFRQQEEEDFISLDSSRVKSKHNQHEIYLNDNSNNYHNAEGEQEDEEEEDEDVRRAAEVEEALSGAWGKKKNLYYDHDIKGTSKNVDMDLEEEEEVKRLRMEKLSQIDDELYEDDMLGSLIAKQKSTRIVKESEALEFATKLIGTEEDDETGIQMEKVERDFSSMTKKQKRKFLLEHKPELFDLMDELKSRQLILEEEGLPELRKFEADFQNCLGDSAIAKHHQLLLLRSRLLMNICENMSFCLLLLSRGRSYNSHSVGSLIVQLDEWLEDVEGQIEISQVQLRKECSDGSEGISDIGDDCEVEENLEQSVYTAISSLEPDDCYERQNLMLREEEMKFGIDDGADDEDEDERDLKELNSKWQLKKRTSKQVSQDFEPELEEELVYSGEESDDGEIPAIDVSPPKPEQKEKIRFGPVRPDLDYVEGRRVISKVILKNQGLKRYRKRENKNPRMKHRNKYEKAMKKRNALVKTFKGKISNYEGESTGFKDYLIKSTRLS